MSLRGGAFSAYWWARVGALLHRLGHQLLYVSHAGFLFVDDWLWLCSSHVAPLLASASLLFYAALGVPFSWHNMDWGTQLRWIGWDFDFTFGAVSIPSAKLDRQLHFLDFHHAVVKVARPEGL